VDSGLTTNERNSYAASIRKGFWGGEEEISAAERALAALISDLDQLAAEVVRYRARFGEDVADPLTELRLRLQRGE
jgi:hypothetical protein